MAMDKPPATRPKSKLLKFLPKAAPSAITFHNPPFSPCRSSEHPPTKHKPPHPRSGLSLIPPPSGTHRKNQPRNSGDFQNQEPTSPKISCMGQIKNKHNNKKIEKKKKDVTSAIVKSNQSAAAPAGFHKQHVLKRIFGGGGSGDTKPKPSFRKSKSDMSAAVSSSKMSPPNKAPTLSQMQRFSSGRESLAGFDWTAHLAPEKVENRRLELNINYYSDDERGIESDEEDGEPIIPLSAPLMGGAASGGGCYGGGERGFCLEPRKEINLWKRRTMVQPRPLQLNTHG